jgi:manganese/zinc/iron transport system permease protein
MLRPIAITATLLVLQGILVWWVGLDAILGALQAAARVLGIPYNTLVVLLGTGLLGLASATAGTFAVLRGRALVGDAVAHSALPGLAIAYMVWGSRNFMVMLAGAAVTGLLGTWCIAWLTRHTRIKADAAIGGTLSVLFGLGLVLSRIVQDDPSGQQAGLDSFLLGKTAGMVAQDVLLIALVALNVLIVIGLLYKEFKVITFDPAFAAVQGLPVLFLDGLLLSLVVATTIIGLPAVGVVLMAALLILPGVAARFWSDRLSVILALAGVFGLATGLLGTWASATWSNVPAGAIIVLTGAAIFIVSTLAAPRRGILGRALAEARSAARITRDHLLKALVEAEEAGKDALSGKSLPELMGISRFRAVFLVFFMVRRGVIVARGDSLSLTDSGRAAGIHVVKAHRLWEVYLVEHADIPPDHVHRDADEIEHVLSPGMVAELERRLAARGEGLPTPVHAPGREA